MAKRVASEIEKREFYGLVLNDVLVGDNALARRLERDIPVQMEESDIEALLDRMMKTPLQKDVMDLLDDIVFKPSMTSLLSDRQDALKIAKKPTLNVVFKHFPAPSKADGGWLGCKNTHPQMKAWALIYTKYEEYIVSSSRNKYNLRMACEHELPVDIVITKGFDTEGACKELRKKRLLRFVIFEPLAENQKGCDVFTQVNEKTKK